MRTVMSKNVNSISIRKHYGDNMELEILGSTGEGDSKITLYRDRIGNEVIDTNASPVWETEEGFTSLRETIQVRE